MSNFRFSGKIWYLVPAVVGVVAICLVGEIGLSRAVAFGQDNEAQDDTSGARGRDCDAANKTAPIATLHVSQNGSDEKPGQHLATLGCALQVAAKFSRQAVPKVTILVEPGDYVGQRAQWLPQPGSPEIVIQPAANERPKFDGQGQGSWLIIKASFNQITPVTITGMEVDNYKTAISVNGTSSTEGWNGGVRIVNNRFANIGMQTADGSPSVAAVRLQNSRNDLVEGNQFVNIRNTEKCGALHSLYIAHFASHNVIRNNSFDGGCGATIKVRDASNDNLITGNTFRDEQGNALFLDAFCDSGRRSDCTADHPECPSTGNQFTDNRYLPSPGETPPRATLLKQKELVAGCPQASAGDRLSASSTVGAR